jgi:hypothetical protein
VYVFVQPVEVCEECRERVYFVVGLDVEFDLFAREGANSRGEVGVSDVGGEKGGEASWGTQRRVGKGHT